MNELIDKLIEALAEEIEKYILAIQALGLAQQTVLAPWLPPVLPNKTISQTTENDLNGLSVSQLDAWLSSVLSYAQGYEEAGGN